MHAEALGWFTSQAAGLGSHDLVVDVGGRDVNGTVRHLFPAKRYIAVDLYPGPCVDVVADIRDWEPPTPADLVLCAEVLEHAPDPAGVVKACHRILKPGGLLILSCAAPPRLPHSGVDGGAVRPDEHYGNIHPDDLQSWLEPWATATVVYAPEVGDVYAKAVK